MGLLGVYFGLKAITIAETTGKKVLSTLKLARSTFSGSEIDDKVPDEIKIVALFKDEMRRNNISSKEAVLSLSGKDLIIRNFEIPVLPKDELQSAVNFEAKKYIPFKVEELVSDFQVQLDKVSHRNLVLFIGIKKDTLDKYQSIMSQLNLKVGVIEYSAFSILRFVQMSGVATKGVVGIISTDFQEEDEVHFTILENGFPLFSRDITLLSRPEDINLTEQLQPQVLLDKLKTELRISLDYYDRKLPTKNIENTFLLCPEDFRPQLETAIKEMGLPVHFIEASKYIGRAEPFSLSFLKAYGCALTKVVNIKVKTDLLAAKERVRSKDAAAAASAEKFSLASLKFSPLALIAGLLILGGTYFYGQYKIGPMQKEIDSLIALRPKVQSVNPNSSFQELDNANSDYKSKIKAMNNIINKQLYFTQQLEVIPRSVPDGVWLTAYSMSKADLKLDLSLTGMAYAADPDKELRLINKFIANLRENTVFSKYFKDIILVSVDHVTLPDGTAATTFAIAGKGVKEKETP